MFWEVDNTNFNCPEHCSGFARFTQYDNTDYLETFQKLSRMIAVSNKYMLTIGWDCSEEIHVNFKNM